MSKNESKLEQEKAEDRVDRLRAFRSDMTMREIRLLNKCQEGPDDQNGLTLGILWLAKRRQDSSVTFDSILDMKEAQVLEELDEYLPKLGS